MIGELVVEFVLGDGEEVSSFVASGFGVDEEEVVLSAFGGGGLLLHGYDKIDFRVVENKDSDQ